MATKSKKVCNRELEGIKFKSVILHKTKRCILAKTENRKIAFRLFLNFSDKCVE